MDIKNERKEICFFETLSVGDTFIIHDRIGFLVKIGDFNYNGRYYNAINFIRDNKICYLSISDKDNVIPAKITAIIN